MSEESPSPEEEEAATEEVITEGFGDQPIEVDQFMPESIAPYWDMIQAHPLIGAAVLVVVFYLLAVVTRLVFAHIFDRIVARSANNFDNVVSKELRRPVFTTTFGLGLILAAQVAGLPFGKALLINIIATTIIISWMLFGLKFSNAVLAAFSSNPKFTLIEARTIPLFDLVTKLVVLLVASYSLLMVWGINPVGWLASAGIVGIAVGFAAKDTLANLFSGLFILADSPYQIGDFINLDSGERGMVTDIGMRSTRLLTRGDVEITVPNAVIGNAKITNESGGPYEKMRIRVPVGAAYGSDVDHVAQVLHDIGVEHENTCADPEPRVRMRAFGASSLDFDLLVWINQPADRGRIVHELLMEVYRGFARENIEIPYSKHDLYIKEMPQD